MACCGTIKQQQAVEVPGKIAGHVLRPGNFPQKKVLQWSVAEL